MEHEHEVKSELKYYRYNVEGCSNVRIIEARNSKEAYEQALRAAGGQHDAVGVLWDITPEEAQEIRESWRIR